MSTPIVNSDFEPLLANFDLGALDAQQATIYGIHRDYTIGYVNAAWFAFARDNHAPAELLDPNRVLGMSVIDTIAGPLRPFYRAVYDRVIDRAQPYMQDYECSSPDQIRHYHMDLIPVPADDDSPRGLVIVNSSYVPEDPVFDPVVIEAPALEDYTDDDGLLICCSNCRRFRHRRDPRRWDWIPEFLRNTPAVISHSICEICLDYYYPKLKN